MSGLFCVAEQSGRCRLTRRPQKMNQTSAPPETPRKRFPRSLLANITASKMLGVRAGTEHRFTGVWVVVVRERVFVRPWNDKPDGWHRAFLREPRGTIQVLTRQVPVRARKVRGDRLLDAIDETYRGKYNTKASQKWVRGFRLERRRLTTLELFRA